MYLYIISFRSHFGSTFVIVNACAACIEMRKPTAAAAGETASSSSRRGVPVKTNLHSAADTLDDSPGVSQFDCDWLSDNWPSLVSFKSADENVKSYFSDILEQGFRRDTKSQVATKCQLNLRTCDKLARALAQLSLTFDPEWRRRGEYAIATREGEEPCQYLDIVMQATSRLSR